MRDFSNKCIRSWLRISATSCEHQRAASKAERKHGANTRFGSRASVTEKFRPGVLPPEGTKVPLCVSAEGTKPSICANFSVAAAHTAGLPRATSRRNQGEPPAPEAESAASCEFRRNRNESWGLRKSASGAEVRHIAPPSDQAALGPRRVRNKGQDGVHRRRAASVPNCERQRSASTKKKRPGGGGRRARRRGDATLSGAAFCFSETKQASDRRGLSHLLGSV